MSYSIFPGIEVRANELVIQTKAVVDIEFKGYSGLTEKSLYVGSFPAGEHKIDIPYQGLALLCFKQGQNHPVIIGDKTYTMQIENPAQLPLFIGSEENEFFYELLKSGEVPETTKYPFARLMMLAKQLLESSQSIRTLNELTARKKEFHDFARDHYKQLKHSDIVRRLISQYFMMHEYVGYHVEGAPATDIRVKYQEAVLGGVGNWIDILKPYIPEYEVLNYCVSLYYDRSMVTLASLIIKNYRNAAYCPGVEKHTFTFPKDLLVTNADRGKKTKLDSFKSRKTIAFVSDDCPVSMVETVVKARRLATQENNVTLIVAPLQQLSDKHLAMRRMVSGGKLLFVDDEKWRKENLSIKIKLPLFIEIEAE